MDSTHPPRPECRRSHGRRHHRGPPARVQAQTRRDAEGPWGGKTNGVGKYADVNGTKLYYEIHGTGRPLILLHGGLGAIEMFGPNLPALAKGR